MQAVTSDGGVIIDPAALSERRGSPWDAVRLARDQRRPHSIELIGSVFDRFQELHGDRGYRDDPAVVCGIGELEGRAVVIVAQQKGASTDENIERNFGMSYPEGYRKAIRMYRLAERFRLPLITLIDTPGAYPGPEAEERGQGEAIAKSIQVMSVLRTPIIAVVIGEGGSGGALALGVGDVVLMLENAVYSVITPEGCAAILFRSAAEAERAAMAMRPSAPDLLALGIVDGLVPEPAGGAHTDHIVMSASLKRALVAQVERLDHVPLADLLSARYDRFRAMGVWVDPGAGALAERSRPWWRRMLNRARL